MSASVAISGETGAGTQTVPALQVLAEPRKPLAEYYEVLFARLGPQGWWPGRTPFEVIVGAILVQNTAWTNVEKAIANLRRERLLTPRALRDVELARLARLVRSAGYFRQKARKLKAFVAFLCERHGGSLKRMFAMPTAQLREQLLAVHGIGPETADSILLYAARHAVFVVDAYTKRVLVRHGLVAESAKYEEMRGLFERELRREVQLYNEYHALLVNVGKNWCRPREPRCGECPLGVFPVVAAFGPAHPGPLAEEGSSRAGLKAAATGFCA